MFHETPRLGFRALHSSSYLRPIQRSGCRAAKRGHQVPKNVPSASTPVAGVGRRLVAKEKRDRRHADQEWRSYERGEGDESFAEADHFGPFLAAYAAWNYRSRSPPTRAAPLPPKNGLGAPPSPDAPETGRRASISAFRLDSLPGGSPHAPPRLVAPACRRLSALLARLGPRRVRVGVVARAF